VNSSGRVLCWLKIHLAANSAGNEIDVCELCLLFTLLAVNSVAF